MRIDEFGANLDPRLGVGTMECPHGSVVREGCARQAGPCRNRIVDTTHSSEDVAGIESSRTLASTLKSARVRTARSRTAHLRLASWIGDHPGVEPNHAVHVRRVTGDRSSC